MKAKNIFSVIVAIAIFGLIIWKLIDNKQILDENAELSLVINTVIPVTVEKAQYGDIDQQFRVTGYIAPGNELTVFSKTQAVVLKKYKKKGDKISKGTFIAQLENHVLKENLRMAEMDYAKAKKDVERYKELLTTGGIAKIEVENREMILRSAESRITELKDQLANTTIVSPVSGIIDVDYFEEGTLLNPGGKVVDIVNDSYLKMKLSVTEKEMLKLQKGDIAVVSTDNYTDKTFTGIVDVIAPKGNEMYRYSVELLLNDDGKALKAGMYATAVFNAGKSNTKVITVSRKAIVGGLKEPFVFAVKDNKAYKVAVQTGGYNNDFVEITNGISENDIIVISGQINLKDGSEVSVINSEEI